MKKTAKKAVKKTKKTRVLKISLSKWYRGKPGAMLLNNKGKMCCLGFAARQLCGAKPSEIRCKAGPADAPGVFQRDPVMKKLLNDWAGSDLGITESNWCCDLMSTNDAIDGEVPFWNDPDPTTTDEERQARISKLFKRHGIKVVFVP